MSRGNKQGHKQGHKQGKAMKYQVIASLNIDGTVQRKDVIGAIMGQTEGLLGDELELRKLQRTARVGHVDVEMDSNKGKMSGTIIIPSSMDNVETAIIGSALETIDRIGPCKAVIKVTEIQDVRKTKRNSVVDRAKELLLELVASGEAASKTVIEEVRSVLTTQKLTSFHGLTCGPNIESSDSLIIMEGRNDVANVINFGIKNAIACDGAGNMKQELIDLANGKETVIAAIDGDRGGEMLLREMYGQMKVDFVAQAPVGQEWELLAQKTVTKCLSMKEPASKVIARLEKSDDDGAPSEESSEAEVPESVIELVDHLDGLKNNQAVLVYLDGTRSEPIGPKSLEEQANGADGAVAIVLNGPLSQRTLEIASEAAIQTVLGTGEGKGYKKLDDVESWITTDFQ
jgi:DNA primase